MTSPEISSEPSFRRSSLAAAGLLLLLVILFFGPTLLPPSGQALGGHDMRGLFYPWLEKLRLAVLGGDLPWWDTGTFSGYPFLSNPQVAVFYPPTWLAVLLPTRIGISIYFALHFWLSGFGFYLLARDWLGDLMDGSPRESRTLRRPAAILEAELREPAFLLGAATFMFGGFFTARLLAGHMGLIGVHAWIPWLLWGSLRALRASSSRPSLLAGLFLALTVLAGHTTSLLYVALIWGAFVVFVLAVEKPPLTRSGGRLVLLMGTALLVSAGQWLPLVEFGRLAARTAGATFEFATDFSFPPAHLVTLVVPEYFGEPLTAGYWSVPNFEELTAYIGLLPWLAALLALERPRGKTWFLLALILLGFLLALGRYGFLYRLFYDWLPPFRLARAPGRAMFLVVLGGALLLVDGLRRRPLGLPTPRWWPAVVVAGLVAGLAALAATGAVFAAQHPTETSGRLWHQLGGWGWATLLLGTGGVLIWRSRNTRRARWGLALLALVVIDLWTFGLKFRRLAPVAPDPFWMDAVALLPDEPRGRVLPWGIGIFEQNGAGQVGLDSVFGYNALEVDAYSALMASVPDPRATSFDLVGATHVVATVPLDQYADGERGLTLLGQQGRAWVYTRPRPLAVTRLVETVEVIPDQVAAFVRLHEADFDPVQTAIVDRPVECTGGTPLSGEVVTLRREAGWWELDVASRRGALLVLGETAYPGWQASIDGVETDWVTAYGALRAVCVPAGNHRITWRYRPATLLWGGGLSLLGWLALGGVWLTGRRRRRRL